MPASQSRTSSAAAARTCLTRRSESTLNLQAYHPSCMTSFGATVNFGPKFDLPVCRRAKPGSSRRFPDSLRGRVPRLGAEEVSVPWIGKVPRLGAEDVSVPLDRALDRVPREDRELTD